MSASLQTFRAGFDQLVKFLNRTEIEEEFHKTLFTTKDRLPAKVAAMLAEIVESQTARKRYIYVVAIVSLYGLLERFVDEAIAGYVERLGKLFNVYEEMPEAIRERHVQVSIELLKAIEKDRFRTVTASSVIANLHSCLTSGSRSYKINKEAFVLHRGNITIDKITKIYAAVGIATCLDKIVRIPSFVAFQEARVPGWDVAALGGQIDTIFESIEDLVSKRNLVSHGSLPDEIESIDLLLDRCHFVVEFVTAADQLIDNEFIGQCALSKSVLRLGNPIKVFNKRIVCFELLTGVVAVGDVMIAKVGLPMEAVRFGVISSLQIDNVGYKVVEVKDGAPVRFGAVVDFHANESFEYLVLPKTFLNRLEV